MTVFTEAGRFRKFWAAAVAFLAVVVGPELLDFGQAEGIVKGFGALGGLIAVYAFPNDPES